MSQYIGKTISLISNKGLRYVGLLDNINANDATVALKSVRSLGTEGRMAQNGTPNLEVLPGNDVYDYVVFRGSDVKDLSVLDVPIDQVKPEVAQNQYYPPPPTQAPAQPAATAAAATTTQPAAPATSSAPAPTSAAAPAAASSAPAKTATPAEAPVVPAPASSTTEKPTPTQTQENAQPQAAPAPESRTAPAPQTVAQPRPQNSATTKTRGVDIPDTAFDFESSNARFTKEVEAQRPQEDTEEVYNKLSSFFDNISSSNAKSNGTMRWDEEKVLNMDTFGQSSVGGRNNYRGRGRGGRGRGGRGNWRGRGRGRGKPEPKPEWA